MFLFLILADVSKRQGHDKITSWSRSAFQKPLSLQPCSPTLATFTDVPDNCDVLIMGACQTVASEKCDEYLPPDTHTHTHTHTTSTTWKHFPWVRHFTYYLIIIFKIILKIYLFLAVLSLCCCTGFSPVGVSRGYLSLHCTGFLQWLVLLHSTGSRAPSFSSCGTWAQWLQLPGSRVQAQ